MFILEWEQLRKNEKKEWKREKLLEKSKNLLQKIGKNGLVNILHKNIAGRLRDTTRRVV